LKRSFDIFFSALGLLLLAPLGLLLAALVKLADGGQVFYGQLRVGQFGRPFRIWKFRSMVANADQLGLPLTSGEDPRVTRIGRFLRSTKLDELPQLWNVLVGEMSFVGPRPEVPRYVERYTPEQREILAFKPGITDMASMLFRNEQDLLRGADDVEAFYVRYCLPRKIELNRQYAAQASLLQDIWIIVQTLCPYWLGVFTLYTAALVCCLWFAYLLRLDFVLTAGLHREFLRAVPWVVGPQLLFLFWRGQMRGLLSYFSLRDLRRTVLCLFLALAIQFPLVQFAVGQGKPFLSILLVHFLLSICILSAIRLTFRSLRERSSGAVAKAASSVEPRRFAIVGTGDLATRLALEFSANGHGDRRVVAFFDDDPYAWNKRPHDIPVVGMPECLLNPEWLKKIDEVIVALPERQAERAEEIRTMLKQASIKVSLTSTES